MVAYNVEEKLARDVIFGLKASILKPHGKRRHAALREHYDRMDGLPWHGRLLRWKPAQAEFRAQWPLIRPVVDDRDGGV